ncbi:hypothetical protein N7468_002514 [Penicillium chermesinum]|uniref:Tyrosine specific protein phosphatases domain-containing protein n=1 Tax=Penicillium chermesinum TaxID=63820 RepID=A0A9W9PIN1_9EURO|nr:uncharacterized protein N7468_002514 [Penicillium chermesinum]KAJ5247531.1 hypothetical protein N7468_002514 [Penicillium chermesinum]
MSTRRFVETPMSFDENATYTPTQQYTTVSGALPNANPSARYAFTATPPLNNSETVIVDNNRFSQASHQFSEGDYIPPGFFQRANLDGFTRRFNSCQWTYEMRREAQLILPFLALGPQLALRDTQKLQERGFTLLLAIRNTHSAQARLVSGEKAATELGIMADTIDVLDGQELISSFPRAIRRINDHLAGGNGSVPARRKVLIFCESGNDRSAVVTVAYIMVMLNKTAQEATRLIQENRYCASFDEPMRTILRSFEDILGAKRVVESVTRSASRSGALRLEPPSAAQAIHRKRSFADRLIEENVADHGDMDLDDEDDLAERRPLAPFEDRLPV